jgi:hypothetical protein
VNTFHFTVNSPLRGGVHTSPAFSSKLLPCSALKKKCNVEYDLLSLPPQGWFRNVLCCVIDFEKGVTIVLNEGLA